ncbi:hypothetical protein FRC12_024640 [Ceratobasidium sp. 428]|nr:hypothetical protein FRC12_024640 [Ceratobasidium sp. 428]
MASTASTPPTLDDLSTTHSTSDTTNTTIKLSRASSPRRLLKGTSAAAKMIGSAIGLPGVSEVGQMAVRLSQQTPNQHRAEVTDLSAHLQDMLHIADPDHSLLERQRVELSRHLESVRRQLDEMKRSNRPLSAARERIEELEGLSKQTDRLAARQILWRFAKVGADQKINAERSKTVICRNVCGGDMHQHQFQEHSSSGGIPPWACNGETTYQYLPERIDRRPPLEYVYKIPR